MNTRLKSIAFLVLHIAINLGVVAAAMYGLLLLQMWLDASGAIFSHYEFLGLAVIFGVVYGLKVFKRNQINWVELILFTCFSITSLAVIVLPSFVSARPGYFDLITSYFNYSIAAWITLSVVAAASRLGWKYQVRYLYSWYILAAVSPYIAYLPLTVLAATKQIYDFLPAGILCVTTILLLIALSRPREQQK